MKLSILIPTLYNRRVQMKKLWDELDRQCVEAGVADQVQIVILQDNGERTVGDKRNECLQKSSGEYVAFFDDDDWPSDIYIKCVMEGISIGGDCVSLRGVMTTDGENPEIFEHSISYKEWRTFDNAMVDEVKYERYPNHLNPIKSEIAKQFRFPDKDFGEDHDWSTQIFKSRLLRVEGGGSGAPDFIENPIMYYYRCKSKK